MFEDIVIRAGSKALAAIRDGGLRPGDVRAVAGAAGGPKWLVLYGLDRALFGTWLRDPGRPLFLIGASIGSWRFAAVSRRDPLAALERLEQAYIHQSYTAKPSPEQISRVCAGIVKQVLEKGGVAEILTHPFLRLNVLAARARRWAASEVRTLQFAGALSAFLCNAVDRRLLQHFYRSVLFSHPADPAPFFPQSNSRRIERATLSADNLAPALLASGSIPLIMAGVADIPGAAPGIFRDGGVTDYHLDIPYLPDDDAGIVLLPHFMQRIIPGWFDKRLTWRMPDARHMAHVVMVAPSQRFVQNLPMGKVPDRKDFYTFAGNDRQRIAQWKQVVRQSVRLADAFMEAVESGRIRRMVTPLS